MKSTFKDFLKPVNEEITKADEVDADEVGYIGYALYVIAQMHVYHWLTKSGQIHEALGEYYEELSEELDEFTEMLIGKYGIPEGDESFTLDFTYDDGEVEELLEEFDSLTNDVLSEFDEVEDAAIIAELVEIKELNDKLRYKIKLED